MRLRHSWGHGHRENRDDSDFVVFRGVARNWQGIGMSKPVKAMITAALLKTYDGVDSVCVVDIAGLDMKAQESIRSALEGHSARLQVVKNSMAKQAFKDTALEPIGDALQGPCAIVAGGESIIEAAKTLVAAAKEFKSLTLKQAIVEGDPELITVVEVAKLKGRLELLGEVAMLVSSPGRAIAGCISSPQSKIAGCLKAIVEKAA